MFVYIYRINTCKAIHREWLSKRSFGFSMVLAAGFVFRWVAFSAGATRTIVLPRLPGIYIVHVGNLNMGSQNLVLFM